MDLGSPLFMLKSVFAVIELQLGWPVCLTGLFITILVTIVNSSSVVDTWPIRKQDPQ